MKRHNLETPLSEAVVSSFPEMPYRLIDLENAEIGPRCISTGPSPLDLGIGAMA